MPRIYFAYLKRNGTHYYTLVHVQQFMKEILKGLCVYNNKGANQGTYELKPEYKRSIQDPSSS